MSLFVSKALEISGARAISPELRALYSHRLLLRVGLSLVSIFSVIFIFELFDGSFFAVLLAYGALHGFTALLTPFSAKLIQWLGVRTMLFIATPSLVLSMVALFFTSRFPEMAVVGISAYIFFVVFYKALYWVPYNLDLARLLDRSNRGRQVAFFRNVNAMLKVMMPLAAGFVIAWFGFSYLFLAGMLIILIGLFPLARLGNVYEQYRWDFFETFRQLLARRNRNLTLTHLGDGAQLGALAVIWPLFVFLLLEQQYIALGGILALTLFVVLLIQTFVGNLFDRWDRRRVLTAGAIISSTGWLIKIFVGTPIQIFAADTYHGVGRAVNRTSIDAMTYEQAADNGRYVDEYTALKEIASSFGKLGILLLAGAVAWFTDIHTAFIVALFVAALATLATMLLSRPVRLR